MFSPMHGAGLPRGSLFSHNFSSIFSLFMTLRLLHELKAATEPRECVLSLWTAILRDELMSQGLSIENAIEDLAIMFIV